MLYICYKYEFNIFLGVPLKYLTLLFLVTIFLLNCDTTSTELFRPRIYTYGSDTLTIRNSSYFSEPGYSCTDVEEGDITNLVKVSWYRIDQTTPYSEIYASTDSAAYIKYSIKDGDDLTHELWRYIKFTGPFLDNLPWINLLEIDSITLFNHTYFSEPGCSSIGINNSDLSDSIVTTWFKIDKVTPFVEDSAKQDSAAYLRYTVTDITGFTDTAWRYVEFTGPFPEDIYIPDVNDYAGCIRPNNISQAEMDSIVLDYFNYWKEAYLTPAKSTPGGYYIASHGGTGATEGALTVSEAHGFGMLIMALMGKLDTVNSQSIFDGLYDFYKAHPCKDNPLLMAWEVLGDNTKELTSEEAGGYSNSSATDGDIDIAYGLLLAHSLWGSDSSINYLQAADSMINYAIKGEEVGDETKRVLLGSWDMQYHYKTRPSDWMTGEFHAFAELTGETFWNDVVDTIYSIAKHITHYYSPSIGLVPDFVVGKVPAPAEPYFLEFRYDGEYYNNACRVPMRIMTDVCHYEDEDAIKWMLTLANWITNRTDHDPENIMGGYFLATGKEIRNWTFPAFISPLIVATTVSAEHQQFVNDGWELIHDWRSNYYNDCINLMCLLQLSGNWWKPEL